MRKLTIHEVSEVSGGWIIETGALVAGFYKINSTYPILTGVTYGAFIGAMSYGTPAAMYPDLGIALTLPACIVSGMAVSGLIITACYYLGYYLNDFFITDK